MKYKRIRPNSCKYNMPIILIMMGTIFLLSLVYSVFKSTWVICGLITMVFSLVITIVMGCMPKAREKRKLVHDIQKHIIENDLYYGGYVDGKRVFEYYPQTYYMIDYESNTLHIRFRLSGNKVNLRNLEKELSDRLIKAFVGDYEKKGYIDYVFELCEEKRITISSKADVKGEYGDTKILLSSSFSWDYKKTPGFCIIGNTGAGKTFLCAYLLENLTSRIGARICVIDKKKDLELERYCSFNNMIVYACEEDEIVNRVQEVTDEMHSRSKLIDEIGVKEDFEFSFTPWFLVVDELILMRLEMDKAKYERVLRQINACIVSGRSRCIYVGLLSQSALAEYFGNTAFRSNLNLKVALGQMTESEYKMIFGIDREIKNTRYDEMASGLMMRQNIDKYPREFLAPLIEKRAFEK